MSTFVHTQENDQTWIGFVELAKGSVPSINRGRLSGRFKTNLFSALIFDRSPF